MEDDYMNNLVNYTFEYYKMFHIKVNLSEN